MKPIRKNESMKDITVDAESVVSKKEMILPIKKKWWQLWQRKKADRHILKLRNKDIKRLEKSPEDTFTITMFFKNGNSKTFVLVVHGYTFTMKKKTYYLYHEESWYDLSLDMYHLYFMEDHAVPINRETKKIGDENYFTVTPENLKELIEFKYADYLVKSDFLDKAIKALVVLSIINLVIGIIAIMLKAK